MARKPAPLAIELKSASLEAMRVLLHSDDTQVIVDALDARLGGMPGFFSGEPVVIDCGELPADARPDWTAIRDALARHELSAIAVQGVGDEAARQARACALAVLPPATTLATRGHAADAAVQADAGTDTPAGVVADAPAPAETGQTPTTPPPQAVRRTEIIDKPLRSGQRIYARGCDLVVLAMVSAGAEVIADGNIHIYAPLRGRALAGASGDTEARIFTTCFEAELVSIAGVYRTFEHSANSDLLRRPVHVRLQEDSEKQVLNVAALATT
ncbi:MAG: septum site-determining protein MinC [Gammaproteobacteria bacterium]|jgi:septum site-determining protein MinC|nr:septum site-determining protein MinC [Gammaproteobacteria bacterium]MBU0771890.1 septum site-determining protein MinC [Gammaproteobacteria bacterium]MBU0856089.1 septum site-determining protein MinC [Gammaproteobacteria bacterium]MBU1846208.1 septum site-determining protein MinC [Gammaproteobacteria bacterium]